MLFRANVSLGIQGHFSEGKGSLANYPEPCSGTALVGIKAQSQHLGWGSGQLQVPMQGENVTY